MKIYLLNLIDFKRSTKLVALLLVAVLIFTGTMLSVDSYIYTSSSIDRQSGKPTIIIDAGHGGEDSGATSSLGFLEKDLNLAIAKILRDGLVNKGYEVVMTRTEDKMLYSEEENIKGMRKLSDLKNRCAIAAKYPESIFISIHMNSFGSSKYSGLQVYYSGGNEESRKLANAIQNNVRSELQPENNRVTKNGKDLYILENCSSTSVIVECGFMSNNEECQKLSTKEYQNQLSSAIICGIISYINS